MTKFVLNLLAPILLVLFAETVSAQAFTAIYDFSGVATASGRTDPGAVPIASGVTFGSFIASATVGANSSAGGRFSFPGWSLGAITGSDVFTGGINTAQYYEVTLTPQLNIELSLQRVIFTLQRSGTGIRQYSVRSSIDGYAANLPASINPANVNLQVVAGNVFQVSDATTAAENGSRLTLSGTTALQDLATPVTFRFYGWNAEGTGGTFSLDNVSFSGSTTTVMGSPVITLSTAAINFPPANINTSSADSTFTVQGENLTEQITISTTAPFSISDAANGSYSTSLVIPAADVAAPKTVYLKFTPSAATPYNGNVHVVSGITYKDITATGDGIDPANLVFNFNNCSSGGGPGLGFISYSVIGAQRWACSNFGNSGTRGVDVNGFSGGVALDNEDWLISPALTIGSLNLPIFSFYSRGEFSGPSLQLLVSTDYDGSSNPNTATWTDLQANFPPLTNVWTFTDGINLTAYKSFPKIYIGFKYTSAGELGAARWTLDDVTVNDR
ncbi:MAG: choice-of-anchor J domain-containing protein, partial [Chitinophagaceae bacterium]